MRYEAEFDGGYFGLLFTVLWMTLMVAIVVYQLLIPGNEGEIAALLLCSSLGAWQIWMGLGIPKAIVWPEDGVLIFEGIRSLPSISPRSVVAVYPAWGFVTLLHSEGKVTLNRRYSGQAELKARLAKANPYADLHNWK